MLVRLAGSLLAPDLDADPAVREHEHGQREAVLQEQEHGGVLRLLAPVLPHLGADVALVLPVPGARFRHHEARHDEDRHCREHARQPNGRDDPLECNESQQIQVSPLWDQ